MPTPDSIRQLIERFKEHRDSFRSGKYTETQMRREFINRLVYNLYGLTEEEVKMVDGSDDRAKRGA
jgi:hypothetical protein